MKINIKSSISPKWLTSQIINQLSPSQILFLELLIARRKFVSFFKEFEIVFEIAGLINLREPLAKVIRADLVEVLTKNGRSVKKFTSIPPNDERKEYNLNLQFLVFVNADIYDVADTYKIGGNFSSHSFRIARINRLLERFSLSVVTDMIGHKNVQTTYNYFRLVQNKEFVENLELVDDCKIDSFN